MYYNQRDIIQSIQAETNYSLYVVERVLEALKFTVEDIITNEESAEIKIFPGFSIVSKSVPIGNRKLILSEQKSKPYVLSLRGKFTQDFRQKLARLKRKPE